MSAEGEFAGLDEIGQIGCSVCDLDRPAAFCGDALGLPYLPGARTRRPGRNAMALMNEVGG